MKCWAGFLSESEIKQYKSELVKNAPDLLAIVHLWKTKEQPTAPIQENDDIDMMDLID